MAFEIRALLTNEARQRTAVQAATGKSFAVTAFALGNAGHDPLDPTTALAPDPESTTCLSTVFGPKAVSSYTFANDSCPVWECLVDKGEGVTLFSSVCLLAQILSSPIPGDPEVGTLFLYALCNLPQRPKFAEESLTLIVGTQR